MPKYIYRNRQYSVEPCVKEDIPSHTERVLSYWESTNTTISYQLSLLQSCIETGEAFKILDDSSNSIGCLYWKGISEKEASVYFCWFKNGLALALEQDYAYRYFPYETIYYMPHSRERLSYKSMLTLPSILVFHKTNLPVPVNIRNPKIMKHYRRYFNNSENSVKEV